MAVTYFGLALVLLGITSMIVQAYRSPSRFEMFRSRGRAVGVCAVGIGFLLQLIAYLLDRNWWLAGLLALAMIGLATLVRLTLHPRVDESPEVD